MRRLHLYNLRIESLEFKVEIKSIHFNDTEIKKKILYDNFLNVEFLNLITTTQ